METEIKYKLENALPFIILIVLFIIGCLTTAYCNEIIQYIVWGIIIANIIGFLIYIKIKNK